MKGRQTQDNIRRTLQIMDHIQNKNISAALISLDAEKAFDSVNWTFLYLVLKQFRLDAKAVKCIKTLYQRPTAKIRINGSLTESITLERSNGFLPVTNPVCNLHRAPGSINQAE